MNKESERGYDSHLSEPKIDLSPEDAALEGYMALLAEHEQRQAVLERELAEAETNFRAAQGRDEYQKRMRVRDAKKGALETHKGNRPVDEWSVGSIMSQIAQAERQILNAKDQQERTEVIKKLDAWNKRLAVREAEAY